MWWARERAAVTLSHSSRVGLSQSRADRQAEAAKGAAPLSTTSSIRCTAHTDNSLTTTHARPQTTQGHTTLIARTMAVLSSAPLQFIASIPPVTRAFTAATVITSLVYYYLWWTNEGEFSVPYLVLVPGSSLFYPWTFVTSALVETTVLEVRHSRMSQESGTHAHAAAFLHFARYTSLTSIFGEAVGCD